MILIFSIKSSLVKSLSIPQQQCDSCKKKNNFTVYLYQRYVSWLIPMMPAGKFAELKCDECNALLPESGWSKEIKEIYAKEKRQTKTLTRFWAGTLVCLGLLAGIVVYIMIQEYFYKSKVAAQEDLLNSPEPGYILRATVNDPANSATFFKVSRIIGDTVFVKRYNHNWDVQISNEWQNAMPAATSFEGNDILFSLKGLKNKKLKLFDTRDSKYLTYYGFVYEIISAK